MEATLLHPTCSAADLRHGNNVMWDNCIGSISPYLAYKYQNSSVNNKCFLQSLPYSKENFQTYNRKYKIIMDVKNMTVNIY